MELIGDILKSYLKDIGVEKPVKRYEALSKWSSIVGKRISDVTEPVRITDGKIFIKVKSDVWRNELLYQKQKIIKDINHRLESKAITDIVLI
jgi:predicted nucleic acid-binding Zn ribbon protein